jgi:hypothetical protein
MGRGADRGRRGKVGATGFTGAAGPTGASSLGGGGSRKFIALGGYGTDFTDTSLALLVGLGTSADTFPYTPGDPAFDLYLSSVAWAANQTGTLQDLSVVLYESSRDMDTSSNSGFQTQLWLSPACGNSFTGTSLLINQGLTLSPTTYCLLNTTDTVPINPGDRVALILIPTGGGISGGVITCNAVNAGYDYIIP